MSSNLFRSILGTSMLALLSLWALPAHAQTQPTPEPGSAALIIGGAIVGTGLLLRYRLRK